MQREKVQQAHIVQLLASLGAHVYVTGTRRPRGDYQGTCMTPGVSDLIVFLPDPPRGRALPVGQRERRRLLCIECKATGGRLSPPQRLFSGLCTDAGVDHVVGDLNDVIRWLIERHYLKPENVPHYRLPQEART